MTDRSSAAFAALALVCLLPASAHAQSLPQFLQPIGSLPAPFNLIIPNYQELRAPYRWDGIVARPGFGLQTAAFDGRGGKVLKDARGFRIGVEAGYHFQAGNVVFGPVADLSYSFANGRGTFGALPGTKSDLGVFGSVRGKLGYTFDRVMVYGTGGLAFGDIKVSASAFGLSDRKTLIGWTAGGGLSYLWSENAILSAEYRRVDLGEERFAALPVATGQKAGLTMDVINVGFSRKF